MCSDNRTRYIGPPDTPAVKSFALIVCLLAILASAGCGGSTSAGNSNGGGHAAAIVTGTVTVGTTPRAIAVDSSSNKIYVADFGEETNTGQCQTCYCVAVNGSLTMIDGTTESPTTTGFSYAIQNPLDLAVNPANHTVYAVSRVFDSTCGFYLDQLEGLHGATLILTAATPLTARLGAEIDVNEETGYAYVTDWHDSTVTVLDGNGNLVRTIAVGSHPVGVAVNATTQKIYVANSFNNDISVIDGVTNSVTSTISSPQIIAPGAVAVNPTTNTIYVANGQSCFTCPAANNLAVIDGASGSVTTTIPVGTSPAGIAVDTQTNFIYVANAGNFDTGDLGNVTVINGATNTVASTLKDPNAQNPSAVAVNPATNKIYVANSGSSNVTVIDGAHD